MTTMPRWIAPVIGLAVLVPGYASAQDIEYPARVPGRELSQSYVERLRRNAQAYRAQSGWVTRAEQAYAANQAVTGDLPIVAIPALFADSPEPTISADDLSRILFDGPDPDGTLREFYDQVSGGRLYIYGEVAPWVRTSLTMAEVVGEQYGLGDDARVGEYLVEALTLADPTLDFGLYDNDGLDNEPNSGDDDGIVDALAFYFLEISASCGGPGIWPHFFGIRGQTDEVYETDDLRPDGSPIIVDPYLVQSIVTCDGSAITPITTVAHEMGHNLGLPDLYHPVDGLTPENRRWVVGCWSLMAAGAWGCGTENRTGWRRPTHIDAWGKLQLGWLDEIRGVPQTELVELTLTPVQTSREILAIPLGAEEWLLIEYRERTGFDLNLPASGVLIYRTNDTIPFRPCRECPPIYGVQLLEADGDSTLVRTMLQGGNRGEAGDAYGVEGPGALTSLTEPSTRLDGGLGEESDVNIYEITLQGGTARLLVSTAPFSIPRLLAPLLLDDANLLTEPEEAYLDQLNNGNGRYDVGDLRAHLQRTGGGP